MVASPNTNAPVASRVVFLSANDIYKLLPDDDGLGGIAQFATLLDSARARLPPDAHVIVTVNGDIFWRNDTEPPFKAELMIEILHRLAVDYVVLGNHEFDFGAQRCLELLPRMKIPVFGSNARLRDSNELFPGVTDFEIVHLAGGSIKLGFFGVLTSNPHEFVVPDDPLVVFESELVHVKRCVRGLQAADADVIVALTHTRLAKDRLLARQVPGIHLILGGHDHEPFTMFEKTTLIHKSGCDALWLAQVDLFIRKEIESGSSRVTVQFGWTMMPNRGYAPKREIQNLLDAYSARVNDSTDPAMKAQLAVSHTRLDGTRLTLRTQESNLGNLVADAMRAGMAADVAFINAGFIQCERSYRPGLCISRSLLLAILPIPNTVRCVAVTAASVKRAFLFYLAQYPHESSTMPHVAGVFLVYSIDSTSGTRVLNLYYDRDHQHEIPDTTVLRVAGSAFMLTTAEGSEFFEDAVGVTDGPIIRELVATFLSAQPTGEIAYPQREGRVVLHEV